MFKLRATRQIAVERRIRYVAPPEAAVRWEAFLGRAEEPVALALRPRRRSRTVVDWRSSSGGRRVAVVTALDSGAGHRQGRREYWSRALPPAKVRTSSRSNRVGVKRVPKAVRPVPATTGYSLTSRRSISLISSPASCPPPAR